MAPLNAKQNKPTSRIRIPARVFFHSRTANNATTTTHKPATHGPAFRTLNASCNSPHPADKTAGSQTSEPLHTQQNRSANPR